MGRHTTWSRADPHDNKSAIFVSRAFNPASPSSLPRFLNETRCSTFPSIRRRINTCHISLPLPPPRPRRIFTTDGFHRPWSFLSLSLSLALSPGWNRENEKGRNENVEAKVRKLVPRSSFFVRFPRQTLPVPKKIKRFTGKCLPLIY